MPDESCRNCGGQLVRHVMCEECREIIQYSCSKCNRKSDLRFHFDCVINAKLLKHDGLTA